MDKKNKRFLIVCGCVLLLVFVGASVMRCTSVNQAPAEDQSEQVQQEPEKTLSNEDQAKAALSDEQRAKADSYDEKTRAFVAMLEANVWTNSGGEDSLVFKEGTFIDTSTKGQQRTVAYVITALAESSSAREGEKVETTIAAVETAAGTDIITFEKAAPKGGEPIYYVRSALFFSPSSSYARTQASSTFEVRGLNDDVSVILGGTLDDLKNKMKDFCARQLPVVRSVTWTKTAVIDWVNEEVILNFEADNDAKTKLSATYSMTDHTYTITAFGMVH